MNKIARYMSKDLTRAASKSVKKRKSVIGAKTIPEALKSEVKK
ncbi:hypothetical protein MKX59_19205 [Paenibacillus sp. FSL R7-0340]